jgi:stalled ribosome rescue protein Dom34
MKKEVGLWVDHRRAVIVISLDQEEEIKRITSNVEKHVRYSGASYARDTSDSHHDTTEDGRDRRFDEQLSRYYDEIISHLHDATSILIMGPGEAKAELQKRFEGHEPSGCIVAMITADRMTDQQIAASVRQHFRESQQSSNRTIQRQSTVKET